MPIGKPLDAHDEFRMALGQYYKVERDRSEKCLADIITILANPSVEHEQIEAICKRLTEHYQR